MKKLVFIIRLGSISAFSESLFYWKLVSFRSLDTKYPIGLGQDFLLFSSLNTLSRLKPLISREFNNETINTHPEYISSLTRPRGCIRTPINHSNHFIFRTKLHANQYTWSYKHSIFRYRRWCLYFLIAKHGMPWYFRAYQQRLRSKF